MGKMRTEEYVPYIVLFFISCVVWLKNCYFGRNFRLSLKMFHVIQMPWFGFMVYALLATKIFSNLPFHLGGIFHIVSAFLLLGALHLLSFYLYLTKYSYRLDDLIQRYLDKNPEGKYTYSDIMSDPKIFSKFDRWLNKNDDWVRYASVVGDHSLIFTKMMDS